MDVSDLRSPKIRGTGANGMGTTLRRALCVEIASLIENEGRNRKVGTEIDMQLRLPKLCHACIL